MGSYSPVAHCRGERAVTRTRSLAPYSRPPTSCFLLHLLAPAPLPLALLDNWTISLRSLPTRSDNHGSSPVYPHDPQTGYSHPINTCPHLPSGILSLRLPGSSGSE